MARNPEASHPAGKPVPPRDLMGQIDRFISHDASILTLEHHEFEKPHRPKSRESALEREVETMIDNGVAPTIVSTGDIKTVSDLIDLHIVDFR